ncbi:hypothetical protein ABB37_03168 [Leptomonas pyrrhocoris]|uniref:HPP transmembrane region domain-containing protein n=1 Tax=Leptomonas pyrrhocoris TaxID=157538 RepID=A0A0N0DWM2_LEPPY|nr:hypothetical protein ABB37_03168 [Leptomonas pyrrhocoris]KPA81985.1 hypothetical protein ABB37_03168 [Leptomonas pyrrhocoris]|eukprot:XP_015660424.1 hypothetical protein ABB37_03168 [Leptomonas pyrrhocoris]
MMPTPFQPNEDEGELLGRNGRGDAFVAMAPLQVESRLFAGQGGMELSASELSNRPLRELSASELSSSLAHEPFIRLDSDQDLAVSEGSTPAPVPEPAPEGKKEVKPPHGWPSISRFPRWYWSRVLGFDQSVDVYGFYPSWDQLIAFVFTALTLMVMGLIEHYGIHPLLNHTLTVFLPAFGASCTVVFAVPKAPIAQPRNVIISHVSAAIIGTALTNAFRSVKEQPFGQHSAGAIGVALHLVFMMFTNTMHPPASATVISAATATINAYYKDEGFLFVIAPVLFGSVLTTVFSWLLNNLVPSRSPYPQYW